MIHYLGNTSSFVPGALKKLGWAVWQQIDGPRCVSEDNMSCS